MIQDSRIQLLNENVIHAAGDYVLYWMQASQRTMDNHALEYAIRQANALAKPLLVYLGVTDRYPEANRRHYQFMLEGLRDVYSNLTARGIPFLLRFCEPKAGAIKLGARAALTIVDLGYMRHESAWRKEAALAIPCRMLAVETNVLIPVTAVSPKEEYAAATIRRKIERLLPEYALPLSLTQLEHRDLPGNLAEEIISHDLAWIEAGFAQLALDESVPPATEYFRGGQGRAQELLSEFIAENLSGYAENRNDPAFGRTSNLSAYLHFGQISPLTIYLAMAHLQSEDKRSFLDELIIRRELSMNFVHYNPNYDSFAAIGSFARITLEEHRGDPRPVLYDLAQLEAGSTHDPYWNAAQLEMVLTGKMSGYMRMYWGKKVLEWSPSPEEAYARLVLLNNKYSLDGRDPNGYAGIAWCFGKHDRAWAERMIFGKVRYMNDKGLERKYRIREYVAKIDALKTGQFRLWDPLGFEQNHK